jgi:hypothetical protein
MLIRKHTRPQITKRILSKTINTGCITIPDFKLFYRAILIKSAQYQHKNYVKINGTDTRFFLKSLYLTSPLNFLANIVKNKLTTHVGLISCSYFAP